MGARVYKVLSDIMMISKSVGGIMNRGIDVSTYLDVLSHGKKFYDESGEEMDPLDAFVKGGVDRMRLRIWCNPYNIKEESYNAGDCTVQHMIELGKLAASKGFKLMVDLHYSDFWTDPKKQTLPKEWKDYSVEEIKDAMRKFTLKTLGAFNDAGLAISAVQVGNEITNGMLWPYGKIIGDVVAGKVRKGYDSLIAFLKVGIQAVREACPKAKIVLHLEQSGNAAIYDEWFSQMQAAEVDYDVIGMSYYPFWHGTFDSLWANVDACIKKFGKKVVIAEWSYAFTLKGYSRADGSRVRLSAGENAPVELYLPYPATPEGQAQFVSEFLKGAKAHGVAGVFYWEPLWLPGDGIKWASDDGLEYIGEAGKSTDNEWANQCLFDYDGKMLPAFKTYCEG